MELDYLWPWQKVQNTMTLIDTQQYAFTSAINFDGEPARRGSYVLRHWRGDLSIRTSFWVNVVLINTMIVAGAAASVASGLLPATSTTVGFLFSFAGLSYTGFVIALWQYTGVWRSARRSRQRSQLRYLAAVLQAWVVLSVCVFGVKTAINLESNLQQTLQMAHAEGRWHYEVANDLQQESILLNGPFSVGLLEAVRAAHIDQPQARSIILTSGGGLSIIGSRITRYIKSTNLTAETPIYCMSACTTVFMAAKKRILGETAVLGFHSSNSGQLWHFFSALDWITARRRGVSEPFARRLAETPPERMWFPTLEELMNEGIVTHVRTNQGAEVTVETFCETHDCTLERGSLFRAYLASR